MRTLTEQEERIYSQTNRAVRLRVRIADSGGTLVDVDENAGGPWLIGASWGEDVDSAGQTASIKLRATNDRNALSPLMVEARQAGAIALQREVVIDVAVVPYGATVATWTEMFRGKIDAISWASDPMVIDARDHIQLLQDRYIEVPSTYSDSLGNPLQDILQEILDDTLTVDAPTIYTPTAPGWNITQFTTTQQSILDQLLLLVDQIGWNLRFKWDSGTSAFRLTLYEPDRTGTSSMYQLDHILTWQDLDLSVDDIRNVVVVQYPDTGNLDASGQPTPATYTAEDSSSIATYGRRWMGVTEDGSSNIDTATEAQAMAEAILSDLSQPLANVAVEIPFFHAVEIEDRYTVPADAFHTDDDRVWAVIGFRHTVEASVVRTALTLRGTVASGHRYRWLGMSAMPGVGPLQQTIGPGATETQGRNLPGAVEVAIAAGKLRGLHQDVTYELHAGIPGFVADLTMGSSTFIRRDPRAAAMQVFADARGRLPIGETVDVVIYPLDHLGNYGPEIRISDVAADRLGTHHLAGAQRVAGSFLGSVFSKQSRGSTFGPDGWHIITGTWDTDLSLDTGAYYSAPETGKYALTLRNTATASKARSDTVPVNSRRRYHWQSAYKASRASVGDTIQIALEWLDADENVLSTEYLQNGVAAATGSWQTLRRTAAPPTGAAYVRFFLSKSTATFFVSFDRLLWEEYDPTIESQIHRVLFRDDFAGGDDNRIGDLGWEVTFLGADVSSIDTIGAARYPSATGSFSWTRLGVVQVTTPGSGGSYLANYGTLIAIGSGTQPMGYGPPPVGVECRMRVQVSSGTTEIQVWAGLWSSTAAIPDSGLANTISGIGISNRATVTSTNWYGICRNGTSETRVDLGVATTGGWYELGWRRTSSGIQFMVDGVDAGLEITTNLPASTDALTPVIGVATTNSSAKVLDIDTFLLVGDYQR